MKDCLSRLQSYAGPCSQQGPIREIWGKKFQTLGDPHPGIFQWAASGVLSSCCQPQLGQASGKNPILLTLRTREHVFRKALSQVFGNTPSRFPVGQQVCGIVMAHWYKLSIPLLLVYAVYGRFVAALCDYTLANADFRAYTAQGEQSIH